MPRGQTRIKLPFLASVNRDLLALALGDDVKVTRTEVQLQAEDDGWQDRLLEILEQLEEKVSLVGAFSP